MDEPAANHTKPFALLLTVIPLLTVFGNLLVLLAVCLDRSLQTVTNFLIVSLAVSDLLHVPFKWNSFVWDLGPGLCKLYIGMDVACSTASILNLFAISLDRYMAISHPVAYAQYGSHSHRAFVSIFLVWLISIVVALPVFLGANNVDDLGQQCEFTNAYFIIVSSILSFFLPCAAMIVLYSVIFCRLRQREKARTKRRMAQPQSRESDHISTALLSGARMARQVGQQLKKRADQLFDEVNYQSSYPTIYSTSWDNSCSLSESEPRSSSTTDSFPQVPHIPKTISSPAVHYHSQTEMVRSFGESFAEDIPFIDSFSHSESFGIGRLTPLPRKLSAKRVSETETEEEEMDEELESDADQLDENCNGSAKCGREAENNNLQQTDTRLPDPQSIWDRGLDFENNNLQSMQVKDKSKLILAPNHANNVHFNTENIAVQFGLVPLGLPAEPRRNGPGQLSFRPAKSKPAFDTISLPVTALERPSSSRSSARWKTGLEVVRVAEQPPPLLMALFGGLWRTKAVGGVFRLQGVRPVARKPSRLSLLRKLLGGISESVKPSRRLVKKASKQLKREQKATITLAVVLVVFLGCWVPFFSFHLSNALCLLFYRQNCVHFLISFLTTWLGYLNSSLNPLIYTVFDHRFRRAFRNILGC